MIEPRGSAWTKNQVSSDSKGAMLEILKGILGATFKDHVCKVVEE